MKTVKELNRQQLIELKQQYIAKLDYEGTLNEVLFNRPEDDENGKGSTYGMLADADGLIPDDVIFREYANTVFDEEDFSDASEDGYTLSQLEPNIDAWMDAVTALYSQDGVAEEAYAMANIAYPYADGTRLICPAELEDELKAIANRDNYRFDADGHIMSFKKFNR